MRSLFIVIYFLIHFEQARSAVLEKLEELPVQILPSILPLTQKPWAPSGIKENPEDSRKSEASYLYSISTGIPLHGEHYQYVYLKATFKKGAYNKSTSFLSFLKRNRVTHLKPDFLADFEALTQLFEAKREVFPCEALSFYEFFPEKKESYTVTFIRQKAPMDSR